MIATIKARLVEIQEAVPNVKRAYIYAPSSLPDSDLPVFCTFTGQAIVEQITETLVYESRVYKMRLFVKQAQSGVDGEAEKKVSEFLTSVRNVFLTHPLLGTGAKDSAIDFVQSMRWRGDNGVQILPYAGENYIGAEFQVLVKMITPYTISAYE